MECFDEDIKMKKLPLQTNDNRVRTNIDTCREGYSLADHENNIDVTLQLPIKMIKDLSLFAEYHGRDIQVDLRTRLARSLERDRQMDTVHRIIYGIPYLAFSELGKY